MVWNTSCIYKFSWQVYLNDSLNNQEKVSTDEGLDFRGPSKTPIFENGILQNEILVCLVHPRIKLS